MTGRIEIMEKVIKISGGRREESAKTHYKCWCEVQELNSTELYSALQTELKDTLVFKVRICKAIEQVRESLKSYKILYNGQQYEIYAATPMYIDKRRMLLKCNKTS